MISLFEIYQKIDHIGRIDDFCIELSFKKGWTFRVWVSEGMLNSSIVKSPVMYYSETKEDYCKMAEIIGEAFFGTVLNKIWADQVYD
jgi:adenine-specific DNA glycosylase